MARTVKSRREAYDNMAPGGGANIVTTRERTINGALPPDFTAYGNSENISVGSAYGAEKVIVRATALLAGENVG